jgi:hypothetical protein
VAASTIDRGPGRRYARGRRSGARGWRRPCSWAAILTGAAGAYGTQPRDNATQSHADAERCHTISTARGGPFADAFQGGAHTVLAKPARKARVRFVFAQLLQRVLIVRFETDGDIPEAGDGQSVGD